MKEFFIAKKWHIRVLEYLQAQTFFKIYIFFSCYFVYFSYKCYSTLIEIHVSNKSWILTRKIYSDTVYMIPIFGNVIEHWIIVKWLNSKGIFTRIAKLSLSKLLCKVVNLRVYQGQNFIFKAFHIKSICIFPLQGSWMWQYR